MYFLRGLMTLLVAGMAMCTIISWFAKINATNSWLKNDDPMMHDSLWADVQEWDYNLYVSLILGGISLVIALILWVAYSMKKEGPYHGVKA